MTTLLRRGVLLGVVGVLLAGCTTTVVAGEPSPGPHVPVDVPAGAMPITGAGEEAIDQVARNALADLERFWSQAYPEFFDEEYRPLAGGYFSVDPDDVDGSAFPEEGIGCADLPASPDSVEGNAYYDVECDLIAYDRTLLEELATDHGPFLAPVIMAHEFGHAMQGRFGFAASGRSIQDETQADCLAGAWSAWVADGKARHVSLREPELDDVVDGFLLLRDEVGSDPEDSEAHGSAFDRVSAFSDGFDGGVGRCRDEFGPDRLFTAAPFDGTDVNEGNAPYADIVDWVGELLPAFWADRFPAASGGRFRAPGLEAFDGTAPRCTTLDAEHDLGFCADDGTVYFDETDLTGPAYDEHGDFAVATALALPYALAAREQAGLSTDDGTATRSAVCLTGWFAGEWFDGELLDTLEVTLSPGDLDEAVAFLLTYGGDERVFPDVAATGFELVGAFRAGFLDGGAACDVGL